MSVAVALTTQCAYCIEAHIKNGVEAGATREEIAETVFIGAALRAGGAVGNGLLAMRLFEDASNANQRACRPPRYEQPSETAHPRLSSELRYAVIAAMSARQDVS